MADQSKPREYRYLMAPRVSHLDAQSLNTDIHELLKTTLLNSVQLSGVGMYTRLEPEIDAILRWLVYRVTLIKNKTTVGHKLLQMKYSEAVPERAMKSYAAILIIFPWFQKRLTDICKLIVHNEDKREKILSWFDAMDLVYRILHIINLLVFLRDGFYSTIAERFFKLRPIPTAHPKLREISYSFFSRELLWNGFAELLGFVLPLIPTERVHNTLKSLLPSRQRSGLAPYEAVDAELTSASICMVCGDPPTLPYQFGCEHVACHYCLYTKYAQAQGLECTLCGYVLDNPAHIMPVRSISNN